MTINKNSTQVLDETVLTSVGGISGLASPLVGRVLSLYRHEATILVHGIESALVAHDQVLLRRLAHNLKSSSASVGAIALSHVAGMIEHQARQARFADAEALVAVLCHQFGQLLPALTALERKREAILAGGDAAGGDSEPRNP